MNRTELYAAYVAAATQAGITPLANTSFQSKAAIVAATDAMAPPVARCGYIHDKLTPRDRRIARRWWRKLGAVERQINDRWATAMVPAELCQELGMVCHPTPRA